MTMNNLNTKVDIDNTLFLVDTMSASEYDFWTTESALVSLSRKGFI